MSDQPSNPYGFNGPTSGDKAPEAPGYGNAHFSNPASSHGGSTSGNYGPGAGFGGPTGPAGVSSDERTWAILAHLSTLIATLVSCGMLGWVAPFVIYLIYRDKSPFVRNASAGALNFAINIFVHTLIAFFLALLGIFFGFLLVPLVFFLIAAIMSLAILVATIVIPIIAAMKANNGEAYTYPFTVSIIK
ncbi:DUF4870 domain-containing protein [Dermabacter vaginalis]|uniref:DUF4870 domain-containing protein n=1 Tax=Dermabacter vaginalis TaxID=1630135 RepID=UPI0021A678E8|nr:DUF4870 domain-containing protein [Dermabacter vaginalis]MCT2150051.1 DUF4870 domain-containing protein [Dermabacter vaginalis]